MARNIFVQKTLIDLVPVERDVDGKWYMEIAGMRIGCLRWMNDGAWSDTTQQGTSLICSCEADAMAYAARICLNAA